MILSAVPCVVDCWMIPIGQSILWWQENWNPKGIPIRIPSKISFRIVTVTKYLCFHSLLLIIEELLFGILWLELDGILLEKDPFYLDSFVPLQEHDFGGCLVDFCNIRILKFLRKRTQFKVKFNCRDSESSMIEFTKYLITYTHVSFRCLVSGSGYTPLWDTLFVWKYRVLKNATPGIFMPSINNILFKWLSTS